MLFIRSACAKSTLSHLTGQTKQGRQGQHYLTPTFYAVMSNLNKSVTFGSRTVMFTLHNWFKSVKKKKIYSGFQK